MVVFNVLDIFFITKAAFDFLNRIISFSIIVLFNYVLILILLSFLTSEKNDRFHVTFIGVMSKLLRFKARFPLSYLFSFVQTWRQIPLSLLSKYLLCLLPFMCLKMVLYTVVVYHSSDLLTLYSNKMAWCFLNLINCLFDLLFGLISQTILVQISVLICRIFCIAINFWMSRKHVWCGLEKCMCTITLLCQKWRSLFQSHMIYNSLITSNFSCTSLYSRSAFMWSFRSVTKH